MSRLSDTELTRRSLLRAGMLGTAAVAVPGVLASCSSSNSSKAVATSTTTPAADPGLFDAARAEGQLNLIAISDGPESAYRSLVESFRKASKLQVNLTDTDVGSGTEIDKIRELAGKPTQPDVIDVGMSYAIAAADEGLLVPSLPDGWGDVPSAAKDADGLWTASYYGLVGIVANPALLDGAEPPATLDDLRNLPAGVTMGFPADPRTADLAGGLSSAEAFAAVWTVALANGGGFDDIGPGIDFFADLAEKGTFDPGKLTIPITMAQGDIAVTMLNNLEFARAAALMKETDPEAELVMTLISDEDLYPNYYVQAAVKDSPHPAAAQAWLAYLLSDDGAKAFLSGGAIPTRFPALYREGTLTDADLEQLVGLGIDASHLANLSFPTPAQVDAAQKVVNERWGPDVKHETG